MKKIRSLKFILILIFAIVLFPKNVNAATTNLTGDVLYYQQQGYYYGRPDVHNGMNSGYLNDDTYGLPIGSSSYFLVRPIDTNVNFIYGVNQMNVYPSQNVTGGKFYTIRLNIAKGGYIKINDIPSIYNISTSYTCRSNIGTCTWYWDNQTMVVSFQATSSNNGTWYIILGDFHEDNKVLGLNTYTLQEQGWIVQSATITDNNSSSSTDFSPVLNGINGTNSRLDSINNNINNITNKQDTTNDKLDDVNNNISETNDKLDNVNDNLTNINDTINDSGTNGSDTAFTGFINNYDTTDNTGITRLITAPLRLLQALTTAQCNPLEFQLPIIHNQVSLACPRPMYENYFGVFFTLWQMITTGLISYHVFLNIYSKVRAMSNPNNDRIEVLNL